MRRNRENGRERKGEMRSESGHVEEEGKDEHGATKVDYRTAK
jgi:hypothetical protein